MDFGQPVLPTLTSQHLGVFRTGPPSSVPLMWKLFSVALLDSFQVYPSPPSSPPHSPPPSHQIPPSKKKSEPFDSEARKFGFAEVDDDLGGKIKRISFYLAVSELNLSIAVTFGRRWEKMERNKEGKLNHPEDFSQWLITRGWSRMSCGLFYPAVWGSIQNRRFPSEKA
jgi:hypothetical protein